MHCNRALRLGYMQSGGSDPEVLAHMHDLQAEALTLEQARPKADGRTKGRSKKYRCYNAAPKSQKSMKVNVFGYKIASANQLFFKANFNSLSHLITVVVNSSKCLQTVL